MKEVSDSPPQIPKDGEVLEDVICGCCGEAGNVVAKRIKPEKDGDAAKYTFECDPNHRNEKEIPGCGMSVSILEKVLANSRLPLALYIGAEMESAYKKDLGSPHHPR